MYKLIDYSEEEYSDGFQCGVDYRYKVLNINTGKAKWVGEYEFNNLKRKGFLVV